MAKSAAVLVDEVIPQVPVRQWVAGFLLKQAGLKRTTADTGAVTLIQRFALGRQPEHPSALPGARWGVSAHRGRTGFPGKRVFDLDLEHCPQCGGAFRIIAAIEEPAVIVKILTHLGLPARAPSRPPARRLDLFEAA